MNFIPKDKCDLAACKNLESATHNEIVEHLDELLGWLQDLNWPVADPIAIRLSSMDDELIKPIKKILDSDDDVWKYWIVADFLKRVRPSVIAGLREELLRIANFPTAGELGEEVSSAIKEDLWSRLFPGIIDDV